MLQWLSRPGLATGLALLDAAPGWLLAGATAFGEGSSLAEGCGVSNDSEATELVLLSPADDGVGPDTLAGVRVTPGCEPLAAPSVRCDEGCTVKPSPAAAGLCDSWPMLMGESN